MTADIPPPPPPPPFPAPPGGFYPPAPRRGVPTALVITLGITLALLIVLVATGLGLYVNHLHAPAATHARGSPSPGGLTPDSGALVFSDDFHDSGSGWPTGTLASGSTIEYSGGAYVIVGKGMLHHLARSPYLVPLPQLGASVTGTQSAGAPAGAGFGVTCTQGTGQQQVRYQFIVEVGNAFYVERSTGPDSPANIPISLKEGTPAAEPGATPMTVTGDCITEAGGRSTRLALFINGKLTADVTDPTPAPGTGWRAGLVTSSSSTADSTVTIAHFEEHDLSH